jgi:trans-2,3-dihydro-3-hydroxyanthranilate isomerase
MPLTLDYTILDVFAERPLEGNPLAVVHDGSPLSTEQMQAIAREMNLSETTFLIRSGPDACAPDDDAVRVRIFTTQEELPFAGHPTLGTATWLWLNDEHRRGHDTITLALTAGRVPVRFDTSSTPHKVRATMRQNNPIFGLDLDRAQAAQALGLTEDALLAGHAPQVVSTGLPFCVVALRSVQDLAQLAIPVRTASAWLEQRGAKFAFCIAPTDDPLRWRARMQFYGSEDPATGSAAGCAIAYLVQRQLAPSSSLVTLAQGIEILRPSELRVSALRQNGHVSDVLVGGSTIPVARGSLFLS